MLQLRLTVENEPSPSPHTVRYRCVTRAAGIGSGPGTGTWGIPARFRVRFQAFSLWFSMAAIRPESDLDEGEELRSLTDSKSEDEDEDVLSA